VATRRSANDGDASRTKAPSNGFGSNGFVRVWQHDFAPTRGSESRTNEPSAYTCYAYDEPARHFWGCWGVQVARLVASLRVTGGTR
jgi:hypothetical protein